MRRGATIIVSAALLANSACGSDGKLEVRAIARPLAAGKQPVPFRIAEAHGQLALGNVALALESFRKAYREDPSSIEALAGIATCYDRMGRHDLSRRNYEAALAIAPGNTSLLGAFARSLDLQGRTAEAASVRREIVARLAAAAPAPAPVVAVAAAASPAPVAEAKAPVGRSVTVALPPPRPVEAAPVPAPVPVKVALASARSAPMPVAPQAKTPPSVPAAAPVKVASAPAMTAPMRVAPPPKAPPPAKPMPETSAAPAVPAAPKVVAATIAAPRIEAPAAAPGPSVRSPAPVQPPVKAVRTVTVALPPPRPAEAKPVATVPPIVAVRQGPRIERLSRGEVALITTPAPQWKAMASRSAPRFVPLRPAAGAVAEVRLLNAARVDKLAARTRNYLGNRGWRKVMIGDAELARTKSLIVYPPGQRATAARLSKQLGIAMAERSGVRMVTVLLGRDAARPPSQARG